MKRFSLFAAAGALVAIAVVLFLLLTGLEGGRQADKVRALNRALNGAGGADYVAAIAAVRRYEPHKDDADAEVAALTLQGLADPHPATRPPGTIDSALTQMERAAIRHPTASPSLIETTMRYGVTDAPSGHRLIAPQPAVAKCWSRIRMAKIDPEACIRLRRETMEDG